MDGWIGVDLDGTLAEYDGWKGAGDIGGPIPLMVARVNLWLSMGFEVRVFTARVSDGEPSTIAAIEAWCAEHIGHVLTVTNVKDYGMVELWDDRAVTVEANTGRALATSRRGLD